MFIVCVYFSLLSYLLPPTTTTPIIITITTTTTTTIIRRVVCDVLAGEAAGHSATAARAVGAHAQLEAAAAAEGLEVWVVFFDWVCGCLCVVIT